MRNTYRSYNFLSNDKCLLVKFYRTKVRLEHRVPFLADCWQDSFKMWVQFSNCADKNKLPFYICQVIAPIPKNDTLGIETEKLTFWWKNK